MTDGHVRLDTSHLFGEGTSLEFDPSTKLGQALAEKIGGEMIAKSADPKQIDIEHDHLGIKSENAVNVGGIAAGRLRSIIERIERLEEEKKALSSDIKDIYSESRSAGFDVKVIRQIISIRKQEPADVEEQETLLDLYRRALGM